MMRRAVNAVMLCICAASDVASEPGSGTIQDNTYLAEALMSDEVDALQLLQINVKSKVTVFKVFSAIGPPQEGSVAEPLHGEWYQGGFKNGKATFLNGAGGVIRWERSDGGTHRWTAQVNGSYRYLAEQATDLPPTDGWVAHELIQPTGPPTGGPYALPESIKLLYTNAEGTINVEGAGSDEVNGVYHHAGFHGGMPKYAQLNGEHHISYQHGWWYLGNARNTNLYVTHTHNQTLPDAEWSPSKTGAAKAPGPKVMVHDEPMEHRAFMLETDGTINVENAGTSEVNGVYRRAGFLHGGMPRYDQEHGAHHIAYQRGWWYITGHNKNFYIMHSHNQTLPDTCWHPSKSGHGKEPGPNVTVRDEMMEHRGQLLTQVNWLKHHRPRRQQRRGDSGRGLAFAQRAEGALTVEHAGTPEANGMYHRAGFHGGMPKYIQLGGVHHITYQQGWWRLGAHGKNFYVMHSHNQTLPDAEWSLSQTGLGRAPAPKIIVHDDPMEHRAVMLEEMNWMKHHRREHRRVRRNRRQQKKRRHHATHREKGRSTREPESLAQKGEEFVEKVVEWFEQPPGGQAVGENMTHGQTRGAKQKKHGMAI